MALDFQLTIKILIIAIVSFLVITAWDEVIDRFMFKYFNLDPEEISSWLIVAVIATFSLFLLLLIFNIEIHDVIGVGEAVDVQLSGRTESSENGEIIHTPSY